VTPVNVVIVNGSNFVINSVDGTEIVDVRSIKDFEGHSCWVHSDVEVPDEFLSSGYAMDKICCVGFDTKTKGLMTMCNIQQIRCY